MSPTTPNFSFRVATLEDIPIVHPLIESAYSGDESRLGWTTAAHLMAGNRIDEASLLAKITDPNSAILLATTTAKTSNTSVTERTPTAAGTQPPPVATQQKTDEVVLACCEVALCREGEGEAKTISLGLLAVSPRRQGGGIGRAMLAHAEDYCRRRWADVDRINMHVVASRAELIAWYVRRGYRSNGEEHPFPAEELERSGTVPLVPLEELRLVVLEKDLTECAGADGKRDSRQVERVSL
ncbi:acyl-CoA N-acyltransferase [Corynascus novoguineensis]|uniref:Acyl-CoA N-acyltransferase n=1 Tax=Corynascus novoguineensis TaxID=1126955 RepID=A0AAN7HM46_9PEZI|nr:acyl-CoA N-acyltransferase [Corynascus novoguineensis]